MIYSRISTMFGPTEDWKVTYSSSDQPRTVSPLLSVYQTWESGCLSVISAAVTLP